MSIIRIENLTKIYRRRHLGMLKTSPGVTGLNLEIREGEVFSLLGLNGSGKTTTLKLILGLLFPTSGKVFIRDRLMPNNQSKVDIGYLSELPYFYKYLTPLEVLNLYAKLSGLNSQIRKYKISQVLEIVKMKEYATRRMSEFSKGMLQRIGLAQALIHNPSILVFDEPVAGLDPIGIREMRELMVSLKNQGKTILFSSHIISEVEKISDRVGILVKGKLKVLMEQKEWKHHQGGLEEIFIRAVKDLGAVDK